MSALMSLTDEHQMISELLGALQSYAARLRGGATVDPADLARFSDVFRELVDYRHHEKEEGILMPLLARNGFTWSSGLLAELIREHEHLRYLMDVLVQASVKDTAGSREERRQIAEAAMAFVEFKRQHMLREENELFPAIRQRLSPRALEQLALELAQFDEATGRTASVPVSGIVATSSTSSGVAVSSATPIMGAQVLQVAAELVQRYSEDSATVDVSGLKWTATAAKAFEEARRTRQEPPAARLTVTSASAFGRSR